jgi:hypothetical protein
MGQEAGSVQTVVAFVKVSSFLVSDVLAPESSEQDNYIE